MSDRPDGLDHNPHRDIGQGGQRVDDERARHAATRRDEESPDDATSREDLQREDSDRRGH